MSHPDPQEVRAALADFDARHQKIVAALFGAMAQNPGQAADREWVSQRLTEVTLMAGEFEADTPDEGVQVVQAFLQEHAEELLRATYLVFQRVAIDLAPRAAEGFGLDDAMRQCLEYMPS